MVVCFQLLFWNLLKSMLVSKKAIVITVLLVSGLSFLKLFSTILCITVSKEFFDLDEEEGQDPDRINKWKFNGSLLYQCVFFLQYALWNLQRWRFVFSQHKLLMWGQIARKSILKCIMTVYCFPYKLTN